MNELRSKPGETYWAAVAVAGGAAVAGTGSTAAVTLHDDGSVMGWIVELAWSGLKSVIVLGLGLELLV